LNFAFLTFNFFGCAQFKAGSEKWEVRSISFETIEVYNELENLLSPVALDLDGRGNIYILDSGKDRVIKYTKDGRFITQFGGFGLEKGRLNNPSDLSVQNFIYIVDAGNERIVKYDLDGNFLLDFGEFDSPLSLSQDGYGNVYVVDNGDNKIKVYNPRGRLMYEFGEFGWGEGFFYNPNGIAIDNVGNLYIADNGNHRIQVLTNKGRFIRTFGENRLKNPKRIRFWNGFLFCTDESSLYVFNSRGKYINRLNENMPQGIRLKTDIAVDFVGNLYLLENGKIKIIRTKVE